MLWAPLDRSIEFDEDSANAFIDAHLGVDYGYEVLLIGWIDTIKDNYPCRRSDKFDKKDWNICIEPELIEYMFTQVDRIS